MDASSRSELNTRIRQQEVVAELGQQALENDDLDQLMHDATVTIAETLDNDYCNVLELLPGGDEVFLKHGVGWQDGLVGEATVPTDLDSQAGYTLISEKPIIVDDLETESRFSGPDLLVDHDVVSGISVVIGSVEEPWGVLGTHTTDRREFTEHDANFVQNVANVLASAIENERVHSELEEMYGRISDAFFALDEEWRFTHINEHAHEMINPEGQTLVGRNVWEEFPEAIGRKFKEKYEQAMYEQETVTFEEYYPDPLDAWFEVRAYPSETGLSVYFTDVTERKERERELQRTERRFEATFEDPNILVGLLDPDGMVLDINETAMEYIDADLDAVTGEPFWETPWWGAGNDVQSDVREWTERAAAGEYVDFEADLTRPDGQRYTLNGVFRPVTNDDGDVVSVIVSDHDITERKEHERQLEESERRYRTLAENFPSGAVAVYDDDLRFTLAQGSILGDALPSRDQIEGKTVSEVYPPDIVDDLDSLLWAAVEDGETGDARFEFGGRNWRVWATPLRDDDGEIFAGLSFAQDVTEQVERERKLERALDLFEKTERIADVGGWEIDTETKDVFWTDHIFELLEVPGDEEPSLDEAIDMYHEEDKPIVENAVENALVSDDPFDVEVRLRTAASDEIRWLRLQGAPETVDDDVVSLRGAAQDVTERKQREQRLEELIDKLETSNERLEQFAYAASHDLQEPLRMVSSYLQLIEQRYADALDEDGQEFIEFAVDGADRMHNMIEGLLKYSRVDTRGNSFESVDLNEVLADVREDLQVRIEESSADIAAESLPRIEGDEGQLRQVFQNLLGNAIEYSGDEPPQIHVSAQRDGNEWMISVSDEGIGIDPDDADRVFEIFQSLHTPDDHSATGIGLALCRRIVERHGGDIWVTSEPGEGTTFSFTIPAAGDSDE